MESCDVLIVGGGPAGSSCAWKLKQSGLDVIVIDKARFPRNKVCAGWITLPVIDLLQLDLPEYERGRQLDEGTGTSRVLQPITRFITGLIDGPEIETDYEKTVSYGIRRCEFDDYLLRRSGANLHLGESFHSIESHGDAWIVNQQFKARIVVGAGGHFCPVARKFIKQNSSTNPDCESPSPDLPVVVAQEIEFEMSEDQKRNCSVQPDRPELFFCPDLKGYGWVFRKNDFLNIGLGREGEDHLSGHVSHFIEFLHRRKKLTFPSDSRFHGHAYFLRTTLRDPSPVDGILLVGDALGLADRKSGEGIRPAIESGLMCAESIIESISQGRELIRDIYKRKLCQQYPTDNWYEKLIGLVPASFRRFAARTLMSTNWFNRRVVLDRWFLDL